MKLKITNCINILIKPINPIIPSFHYVGGYDKNGNILKSQLKACRFQLKKSRYCINNSYIHDRSSITYLAIYGKVLQVHLHISHPKSEILYNLLQLEITKQLNRKKLFEIKKTITSLNAPIRDNTLVSLLM